MKKLLFPLGFCLLVTAPVAVPTAALAEPGKGSAQRAAEICREYVESGVEPSISFGDCLSRIRSGKQAFPAKVCGEIKGLGDLADYGWKNVGDCIEYFNNL